MPRQTINNLAGMMNTATTDELMRDSEVRLSLNANSEYIGAVQKELGYAQEGSQVEASENPRAGHGFYDDSGNKNHLVVYDQDIYEDVSGTWTSRYAALTADKDGSFETYLGRCYYSNGTDQPVSSSDGATWSSSTNVTNMPSGKYLKKANGLLYTANLDSDSEPLKVWFCNEPDRTTVEWGRETGSDLAQTASSAVVTSASAAFKTRGIRSGDVLQITDGGNAGTYNVRSVDSETQLTLTKDLDNTDSSNSYVAGSNWFEVRDGVGPEITGLAENNNRLIVFKDSSMHRWDETSLTTISSTIGTPAPRSIQTIDRFTFFFNRTGIYMYDGRSPVLISKKVEEYIKNMSAANYTSVWSIADDKKYYCWIGNVTEGDRNPALNNVMLIFDRYQKSWTIRDDIQGKLGWSFLDSSENFDMYFGNTADVFKFNSGNNNNSRPIHFELETKQYDQQVPQNYKKYTGVWVTAENGEGAELMYRVGKGAEASDYKPLGKLNNLLTYISMPNVLGTWIQFKINESGTAEGPKIKALTIDYDISKPFGT